MRDQRYRGISLPIHRTKKTNNQHKAIWYRLDQGGSPYAQTSRRYSGRRLSLHLYRSDEEQAVQRLNRFDSCVYLIGWSTGTSYNRGRIWGKWFPISPTVEGKRTNSFSGTAFRRHLFSGHVPVVYTSLAPGCLPESRAGGYGLFRSLYRNRHTGSKRLNHRRSHRIVSAAFFSSKNGGVYPLAYR